MSTVAENDPMAIFRYGLRAPDTRRQYPRRFQYFLNFLKLAGSIDEQAKQFVTKARENPQWAQEKLISFIQYQKDRVSKAEICNSTITNYYKATKLFCIMNDLSFNWKKISRGLPVGKRASNDRAPTIEEIRKLIEYPDRRIKPIVFTMIASGIRIGAWDFLRWKNILPLKDKEGEIVAAKLVVYSGDSEEYYCFITPEAYASLNDWMEFRTSYGEKITGESWVMRDIWQTTNIDYGARLGLATCPRKLKSSGVKRLLERALWDQGLRHPLKDGEKRHEWKAAHGFRKFYKTHAEQVMKPINVEITMGHNIGVSASYYRPTEHEVLQDFLRAVPSLTVNSDNLLLQEQVKELNEKTKNEGYMIRGKLLEKDETIRAMREKYDSEIDVLKHAIFDMQELLKNPETLFQIAKLTTKTTPADISPDCL